MSRILAILLLSGLLYGCGGGGGGSSDSTPVTNPPESEDQPEPTPIELIDSVPTQNAPSVDADLSNFNLTHLAQSDLSVSLAGDCSQLQGSTVRRNLLDMAGTDFDQVLDHHVSCNLSQNSSYEIQANGTRSNDARFAATLNFSTGTAATPEITVLDSVTIPASSIDDIFGDYVEGALISELDVPGLIESLIVNLVIELAEANWETLTDPDAIYSVTAERVSYPSTAPDGSPITLSGLIARPIADAGFTPRNEFIILTHATGSTPGDLNPADAWFILANMFASRGYLVIAADNYGRGLTSEQSETYLMANRTAYNTLDLARLVRADSTYTSIYGGNDAVVVGYSQGGHTAMAVWLMNELNSVSTLDIPLVYSGGAPHNLYQTVRGVMQHVDGSCTGSPYCEFVDDETTLPFATNRIFPALFDHTETGLNFDEVVLGDTIADSFVSGFLANEAEYDTFKTLLLQNSFTSIGNPEIISNSSTTIHLYHSEYDRLVPNENTAELAANLEPHLNIDYHQNRCNASGYEVIFNLTEKVGVLHTLCGLAVLDDAMQDLQ